MAGRRKDQVEFTIEDLDRELIARGAQIPREVLFRFKDIEGTPDEKNGFSTIKVKNYRDVFNLSEIES
jgi:hypothetical protein